MKRTVAALAMALLFVCVLAVPALADVECNHHWSNYRATTYLRSEATCTSYAVYYKSCSACGVSSKGTPDEATFEDEKGDRKAHDFSAENATEDYLSTAATCISKAVYFKSCSVCGAKGTETFEHGEFLPHDFTEKVDAKYLKSAATCEKAAEYCKSCSVCGAEGEETFTSGNALGHKWRTYAAATYKKSDATCTEPAMFYTSCKVCNASSKGTDEEKAFSSGSAKGHSFGAEVADAKYLKTAATCTEPAEYYTSCKVCGESSKGTKDEATFKGEALGHDFTGEKATADYLKSEATCEDAAEYYKSCTRCGLTSEGTKDEATFAYGDPNGHNFISEYKHDKYLKSEATCEQPKTYYKNCTVCKKSAEGIDETATFTVGKALGHIPSDWQYEYERNGYTYTSIDAHVKICKRCGELLDVEDHNFGKGVVTKMPDCWDASTAKYTCQTCGYEKIETLPKLGHWYETIEIKSTCTGTGYTAKKCVRCGLIIGKEKVDAAGHQAGEWEVVTKATCTTKGEEILKCTVCDALLDTREIKATGHKWGEWKVVTAATTEKEGQEQRVCANDATHVETRAIAKLQPTVKPTVKPTAEPTAEPTANPTEPAVNPTAEPTVLPDDQATQAPGTADVPKTGDSRHLGYAYLMMALAAAGLCVLAATRRENGR